MVTTCPFNIVQGRSTSIKVNGVSQASPFSSSHVDLLYYISDSLDNFEGNWITLVTLSSCFKTSLCVINKCSNNLRNIKDIMTNLISKDIYIEI